jgi:hypothetical protein
MYFIDGQLFLYFHLFFHLWGRMDFNCLKIFMGGLFSAFLLWFDYKVDFTERVAFLLVVSENKQLLFVLLSVSDD